METTLDNLRRQLDSELQASALVALPRDFYSKLAAYSQKLKRSGGPGSSDLVLRLIEIQTAIIKSMSRDLLTLRAAKARDQGTFLQLLPEERYVFTAERKFDRRFDAFVDALASGQPSFVDHAKKSESQRSVTVKFTRHVDEVVGLDLKRYGPFETEDVASLPAANADILIAGGDAVEGFTRVSHVLAHQEAHHFESRRGCNGPQFSPCPLGSASRDPG
jgi:DNA replication factor GINS